MKCQSYFLLLLSLCGAHVSAQDFETIAVVRELEEVEVPARRDGLISELHVRRGHPVAATELIAQMDNVDIKLKMDVAKSDVKRATVERQLLGELGENAVYLEKFRLDNRLEKATAELRILENDLKHLTVSAPVDGVVKELHKHAGEWVQQGEPIAAITRLDKLLVEGYLDSEQVSPHAVVGAKVDVVIPLAGADPVVFNGLVIQHSAPRLKLDGKFPVWVEIENPVVDESTQTWLIRPGMSGTMTVILK